MSTAFPSILTLPPSTSPTTATLTPTWRYTPNTTLTTPKPPPHHLIIRIIATGICHTDIFSSLLPSSTSTYPKILGHEGAGIVEAIGSDVTIAKPSDLVLLSFDRCQSCRNCKMGKGTYCDEFRERNTMGVEGVFESEGKKVCGMYFGQSSFAARTVVSEASVVNVNGLVGREEMRLLAPLGCGLLTGAGCVVNVAGAGEGDVVCVFGAGAVGLGAVMAARVRGCKKIVVVDRVGKRLEVAREVGATDVVDTTGVPMGQVAGKIEEAVGGMSIGFAVETTGVVGLMQEAMKALGKRGMLIQVGIPPVDAELKFSAMDLFFNNKIYMSNILGDCDSRVAIPMMIQWWREGNFPIEKIVKFFDAKDAEEALHAMEDGSAIKPVLIW